MPVIPFYGSRRPDLFAIERAALDRPGLVVRGLDRVLPRAGRLLDIGAGDGFVASLLATSGRMLVALEPDPGMIDRAKRALWTGGDAASLPFASSSFHGAYATWAYFFPTAHSIEAAVREAERVLAPGGVLAIVNNLGEDELCELSPRDIAEPVTPLLELGLALEVIDTYFEFASTEQARALLGFYFGRSGRECAKIRLSHRVGLFSKSRAL